MKTTLLSKENNTVKFTLEFTAEEFDAAVVKAYKATKNQFVIDGFRKGKAPRSIIEKKYGEGIFFEDAINDLFQNAYPAAINELDLEVIESPAVDFSEIGHGKDFTATITVAVFPIVEVKDYKGVEVEVVKQEVKAEDVEKEIESLQKRNARIVSVERPVQEGDTVVLDYSGFVGEEQFEGGTAENQELKIGSGMFIPGFEEQLVGAKAEDKVDVKVTFPEEYHAPELAGKEAVFHCLVHEVKEEQLPELDDEFAKDVSEFDTLDELKKSTEDRLTEYAKAQSENAGKDAVIAKVFEANEIEAPKSMVEEEIDRTAQELDHQLRYQGLSLNQYLEYLQQDVNDFRESLREDAAKKVATRIMLMSIVEAENIELTAEDMEKDLADMAKAYNVSVDEIKNMIGVDNMGLFEKDIKIRKVIDFLYDNAKVTLVDKIEEAAEAEEK